MIRLICILNTPEWKSLDLSCVIAFSYSHKLPSCGAIHTSAWNTCSITLLSVIWMCVGLWFWQKRIKILSCKCFLSLQISKDVSFSLSKGEVRLARNFSSEFCKNFALVTSLSFAKKIYAPLFFLSSGKIIGLSLSSIKSSTSCLFSS